MRRKARSGGKGQRAKGWGQPLPPAPGHGGQRPLSLRMCTSMTEQLRCLQGPPDAGLMPTSSPVLPSRCAESLPCGGSSHLDPRQLPTLKLLVPAMLQTPQQPRRDADTDTHPLLWAVSHLSWRPSESFQPHSPQVFGNPVHVLLERVGGRPIHTPAHKHVDGFRDLQGTGCQCSAPAMRA